MAHEDIDKVTGVATTGHEWDGIKELNNPLPRWWLWVFYATIVFAVGYVFVYPAVPLVTSYSKGLLGYSQRASALDETAAGQAARAEVGKGLANASLEEIKNDPKMLEFAMAQGRAAFGDNCAPCHGSGATGSKGYPNLQDDDWLWGGTLADIEQTITVGVRSTSPDTRMNDMPRFGADGLLDAKQVRNVAGYVLSLSGSSVKGADVEAGKQIFVENCTSCHGEDAKGIQELGAPNLTDKVWLYGGDEESVIYTVTHAHRGVMPTWGGKLDPVTIKSLAIYVHDLGGGT
ncbi:cytochrome-c oxidase, cbb3-type subunit III [Pleomorphomonas diazotrophica]|uniref:Cbb3-type cytochrome c oxidase subunit n=1 Tax=Pleomorphomonas diazotrophica TaxID=1166257 RepID=A0A1I4TG43_9HYPH|nr:cytochrome-c oxidase, cbb3-type subunit III [Pleomorphomonas diazotrophica]PKR87226.1 cytochrome-c oxidase, cbb3-type subunit III [Pleomorphomonas diazotrophica]SFM75510.1 cytochrome c oxidase cbb3-type subunit 3 [Pleomorphomonas diazotrophica]